MSKVNQAAIAFNAGEIGSEVLQRTNLEVYPNTASQMENWMPTVAGPMMFRPGLKLCKRIPSDARSRLKKFEFNSEQSYLLLLSENELRVVLDCDILSRASVTSSITNGEFTSNLAGWTLDIPAAAPPPVVVTPGSGGGGDSGGGSSGGSGNDGNDRGDGGSGGSGGVDGGGYG